MNKLTNKLLLPAILLAGLALHAPLAAADGSGLEWRHGGRHDVYYRHPGERDWRRAPGSAVEVGDGWVIGTDRRNGGFSIYRWDGYRWHRMPGAGVRIGGSYYSPWVVNDRGERFSWNGYGWIEERAFGRRDDRNDRGRRDNDWNNGRRDNDRNNGRRDNDRRDDDRRDWDDRDGNRERNRDDRRDRNR